MYYKILEWGVSTFLVDSCCIQMDQTLTKSFLFGKNVCKEIPAPTIKFYHTERTQKNSF